LTLKSLPAGTGLIEEYLKEIGKLEEQAVPLRDSRDRLNEECRKWVEKRNSYNTETRRIREEAFSYKDRRDALNKAVQELKGKREQAKTELLGKRKELDSAKEKMHILSSKLSLKESFARRRVRELEWHIQTSSLSLVEEKKNIAEVKELEMELALHGEMRKLKRAASKHISDIKSLQSNIDKYHNELSELAKNSQECHEKMVSSLGKADELSKEAEDAHQKFVKLKKEADSFHKSYSVLMSQIREIERQIREIDENVHREQIRKALKSREKVSQQAQQKLETGEKLTFDEFKILIERGEV
jgi:uncharacterized coiled-coil DUF342 family protein